MRRLFLIGSITMLVLAAIFGMQVWQQNGYDDVEIKEPARKKIRSFGFEEQKNSNDFFKFPFLISPPAQQYSLLDGMKFADETQGEFAIGVMIDNATPAREHQAGLDEAPIVIEALAEGGVTRFLAIFSSRQNLETIGPVRSTREYFADFMKPFRGLFVHAGGSDTVLEELKDQTDFFDIDHGILGDTVFWRKESVTKPHNLFTGFSELRKVLGSSSEKQGFQYLTQDTFDFSDVPFDGLLINTLNLFFSYEGYESSWQWNEETQVFVRSQIASPLSITTNNLVVMEMDMWLLPEDEKGRMGANNVGTGEMILFQNGKAQRGRWEKLSREAPLKFIDTHGMPLTFLRGKTWIAVLDDLQKLSFQ